MLEILSQLGVDSSFFVQFATISALFFILSGTFFKPFQALLETRHKRMVEDKEAAEALMGQAKEKIGEYKAQMAAAKLDIRREIDATLKQASVEESEILSAARSEIKEINTQTHEFVKNEKARILSEINPEIDQMAELAVQKLLGQGAAKAGE